MLARRNWQRCLLFPHGGNQMSLAIIVAGFRLGGAASYPGVLGLRGRRPLPLMHELADH